MNPSWSILFSYRQSVLRRHYTKVETWVKSIKISRNSSFANVNSSHIQYLSAELQHIVSLLFLDLRRLDPLHSLVGAYISRQSDSKHGMARVVVHPPSSGTMNIIFHDFLRRICLWPLAGRLKPPARCAPVSGRKSSFSGDLTWKECCWSSICPQRKTESWTPKPVNRNRAEAGAGGRSLGILSTVQQL